MCIPVSEFTVSAQGAIDILADNRPFLYRGGRARTPPRTLKFRLHITIYCLSCITCMHIQFTVWMYLSPWTGFPGWAVIDCALLCVCWQVHLVTGSCFQNPHSTAAIQLLTGHLPLFPANATWGWALGPLWHWPSETMAWKLERALFVICTMKWYWTYNVLKQYKSNNR